MEQEEYDKFVRGVRQIHIRLKVKPLSATVLQKGKNLFGEEEQLLHEQSKIWDRPHLKKWPKQVEDPSQTLGMGTGSQMVLKYCWMNGQMFFRKRPTTWAYEELLAIFKDQIIDKTGYLNASLRSLHYYVNYNWKKFF